MYQLRSACLGVLGATATGINLANDNVQPLDIDGDGTIDWLHQPAPKSYAVYTPQLLSDGWSMVGRAVPASALQDPHLDLGEDTPDSDLFDANGDGLVDVVRATGTQLQTFFSLGRFPGGDGNFGSATWTGPSSAALSLQAVTSCVPLVAPGSPIRFSDPTTHLADMNGDGLQDIVYVDQGNIQYWPGRGDGSFGTGPLGACQDGFASGTAITMAGAPFYSDPSGSGLRLDDVNGDGLDDLVQVRFDAIDVWLNVDGVGWTPERHVIAGIQPASGPLWQSKVRLVDMNGSGTRDVVWGEGGSYRYMDLSGGQRPWVLTHVQNGLGKTTDLQYGTAASLMIADAAAGPAWTSVAPMAINVVTQVTESDHLDVVGLPGGSYVTQYSYRDAVYDGRQREFRGFRTARARKVGDANSPSSTTVSTFLLGDCANDESLAIDPCTPQGRWEDNPREALKGLPLTTETFDDSGTYLSSSHTTYRLRKLYTGLDGREVRVAFESAGDTYLYDTGPFAPAAGSVSLADVERETTLGTVSPESPSPVAPAALALRSSAGRAHLHHSALVDPFGNATDAIDAGCVDCSTPDEIITRHSTPSLTRYLSGAPVADPSGWAWRTVESYVVGTVNTLIREHHYIQYDPGGNPTQTTADLSGTQTLARPTTMTVASTLPSASKDTRILVGTRTYDTFGVLTLESAPNGRCRSVLPDASYHEVPVSETVYVGSPSTSGCGPTGLSTVVQDYDRALRLVKSVMDPNAELTTAFYDGFGRITALKKPDPKTIGSASSVASLTFQYTLPADPTATPYTTVVTGLQDGLTPDPSAYLYSAAAVDGFGRTIGTADQAAENDPAPWIVHGVAQYDAKGAVARAYEPWFSQAVPPSIPFAPPAAYSARRYDAFGRATQTYGLDGAQTLSTVYHALSEDHWDAADLEPGGQHAGTPASVARDGHGRTIDVTERIRVGAIEAHEVKTQYLPTGEPVVITRSRSGSADVVRWLQYDTLGRMVLNVDPDASAGYVPPPGPSVARYQRPPSLAAWIYAYDDNGDLVGTSDARGCGANYLYDAGGRLVGEDFSPCLGTQKPYSAPSLNGGLPTGDGTEAFYQYDALGSTAPGGTGCTINTQGLLGHLVVVADRGALTVTGYDGRGRATCVQRQVANGPVADDHLAYRYVPTWNAKATTYDEAERPVTTTTGADVPQLLVPQTSTGQSAVTVTYSSRGTVKRVDSSYGSLVASVARDADGLINQIVYGDAAQTQSAFGYDERRRLSTVQTYRGPRVRAA